MATRPYPPSLLTAVTAAMSPHAGTCAIAGCPHCQRWRTRAERALDAVVAAGCLHDAGRIRAAERRRITAAERRRIAALLRGPATASIAAVVARSHTPAGGPEIEPALDRAVQAVRMRLADVIETGGAG